MDGVGQAWNRHQWVGDPHRHAASAARAVDHIAAWNLSQWIGESVTGRSHARWVPGAIDTSGGFSGFGQPDSGGQRWATGYRDGSQVDARRLDVRVETDRRGGPA